MDEFDRATEAEEYYRAQALAEQAARTRIRTGDWRELSLKWCKGAGCGERIPDERRRAVPGVELCVECQSALELKTTRRRAA